MSSIYSFILSLTVSVYLSSKFVLRYLCSRTIRFLILFFIRSSVTSVSICFILEHICLNVIYIFDLSSIQNSFIFGKISLSQKSSSRSISCVAISSLYCSTNRAWSRESNCKYVCTWINS